MRALVFENSIPRLAATKLLSALGTWAYLGPTSPFRMRELPDPGLRGDDWAVLQTTLCGLCGSDVKQVSLNGAVDNPMTAYISFPHVIGHEVVGRITRTGKRAGVKEGARVLLYPNLSCAMRGLKPCAWCAAGQYAQCLNYREGKFSPGIHTGNCRDIPGGLAERMPVHARQCLPIPDEVSDAAAVLGDPFAVALHAVLKAPPPKGGTALVYGSGTIGLCTLAVLNLLYPDVKTLAVARFPHQAELARKYGATLVLPHAPELALIEQLSKETGAGLFKTWAGLPVLNGGVDVIYDTIASPRTMEVGLRVARSRGAIVVIGVASPKRFEWTPLYFKELRLFGSNAFAMETIGKETRHGQAWYLGWVRQGRIDPAPLLTHRFPIGQYRRAFHAALHPGKSCAVKVALEYPGAVV